MGLSVVVSGGTVFDGSGGPGYLADVLIEGDRITAIGEAPAEHDAQVIDASGMAVSPGFINILSHAWASMQVEGSAASDLLQGVTTEVFGEATSPGPADATYAAYLRNDYGHAVQTGFRRLGDGLDAIAGGGISPNVASFVGGDNLRHLGAGFHDRPLSARELDTVCGVLAEEMQDGALGIGTALIYAPSHYADTDELAAMCEVVAQHDGLYISHLRGEGDTLLQSLGELMTLNERTGVRSEVYHLKALGRQNWPKMQRAIDTISAARSRGRQVGANMYPYEAGSNRLSACIPSRFHDGGPEALVERLADRAQRDEMISDLKTEPAAFENLFQAAGGGPGILLLRDLVDGTPARGRRLSEVAAGWSMDDSEALLEVVSRDPWIQVAIFFIDPANISLGLRQDWVCVGSDGAAHPATRPWTVEATHPRTYGTFARVLGHYCRDKALFSFPEAIRRMTGLPAERLRLSDRGLLAPGHHADVVVLDPSTVSDTATWSEPHQYARGISHVLVNGVSAVSDGRVTPNRPGRRLRRASI